MRFLLWLVLMLAAAKSGRHLGWTPPADNHPATVQTVSPQISILGDRQPSLARLRQRFQHDQLAPDSLPRRVLAALERSKTDGSFEVQALLTQWFQEDREGLRKWLLAEWRPQAIYRSVARLWVREDLEKAWLENDHQRWHSALYKAIVDLNPQALFTGPHPSSHLPRPFTHYIRDAAMRWEPFQDGRLQVKTWILPARSTGWRRLIGICFWAPPSLRHRWPGDREGATRRGHEPIIVM